MRSAPAVARPRRRLRATLVGARTGLLRPRPVWLPVVILEWEQGQPVRVLVRALADAPGEEHDGPDREHQAHEHQQNYDFQRALPGPRAREVAAMITTELSGMSTAATHGAITPAQASPTAPTL